MLKITIYQPIILNKFGVCSCFSWCYGKGLLKSIIERCAVGMSVKICYYAYGFFAILFYLPESMKQSPLAKVTIKRIACGKQEVRLDILYNVKQVCNTFKDNKLNPYYNSIAK